MIYIFTFLGEFGYELLNWQGVIRKFSRTIGPEDKIVCCSRTDLYPLYEMADTYLDISKVGLFKRGVACAYNALASPVYNFNSRMNILFARQLKAKLRAYILKSLGPSQARNSYRFVFSSDKTELNGCIFGARRSPFDPEYDIYEYLDINNNIYKKIEPDFTVQEKVEKKLGWDLREPFILCQARKRSQRIPAGSADTIPSERLLKPLAKETRVILLSFSTGRRFDSLSEFGDIPGAYLYPCESFIEQILLIHLARHCFFFTEGDFGSHIYLPPLSGRDVTAVAPWTVYQLGTSPVEFWNQNLFRFGGEIIPRISEEVFASEESIRSAVGDILTPSPSEGGRGDYKWNDPYAYYR